MKITDIKFRTPKKNKGYIQAYVDITFDECFIIHNAKIVLGYNGLFLAMPSVKRKNKFVDRVHPITTDFRKYINAVVLSKYLNFDKQ